MSDANTSFLDWDTSKTPKDDEMKKERECAYFAGYHAGYQKAYVETMGRFLRLLEKLAQKTS